MLIKHLNILFFLRDNEIYAKRNLHLKTLHFCFFLLSSQLLKGTFKNLQEKGCALKVSKSFNSNFIRKNLIQYVIQGVHITLRNRMVYEIKNKMRLSTNFNFFYILQYISKRSFKIYHYTFLETTLDRKVLCMRQVYLIFRFNFTMNL